MKLYIFILLLLIGNLSFSQDEIKITGTIHGFNGKMIHLISFHGHHKIAYDSFLTDQNGKLSFTAKKNGYTGLCRVQLDQSNYIDLILDHEDIDFETSPDDLTGNMVIHQSAQNEQFYDYLKYKRTDDEKLNLLNQLVLYYPKKDPFYKDITKQFIKVQKDEQGFMIKIMDKNKGRFLSCILSFDIIPVLDAGMEPDQQTVYLKKHYLDYVNFSDSTVLNSDLVSNKIKSYLSFYMNRKIQKAELENSLTQAVDVIMTKARGNDQVYTYIFEYLTNGFDEMGFTRLVSYLIDNYEPGKTCIGTYGSDNLSRRIDSYKKLAIGNKAPDFEATDRNGNKIKLSLIPENYTLLVFWFSACPHCQKSLPVIRDYYLKQKIKNFEVVAVSLDNDKKAWEDFLKSGNYNWINISDLKGWDNKIADLYSVYATPTMFLIDHNGTIIGKPTDERQLRSLLKENNLIP